MSPRGERARATRIAAKRRKRLFADRGAMRFRAVTSQELPEIRGAQWPLSSLADIQALASRRSRRLPNLHRAGGWQPCCIKGRPGPRGALEISAPATRSEGMPTGAFECGVVWKVTGQKTTQICKCTAADFGAVVTFELQVGLPGLFSAGVPQQGRSRMDRMSSSSLGWA